MKGFHISGINSQLQLLSQSDSINMDVKIKVSGRLIELWCRRFNGTENHQSTFNNQGKVVMSFIISFYGYQFQNQVDIYKKFGFIVLYFFCRTNEFRRGHNRFCQVTMFFYRQNNITRRLNLNRQTGTLTYWWLLDEEKRRSGNNNTIDFQ